MKRMKKLTALLLAVVISLTLLPLTRVQAAENPFVDVSEEDEFYGPVMWAFCHQPVQITNGTDETHFTPDKTVTRGQAVRFLWNAAGQPAPKNTKNPFSDNKSGKFYYTAVLWAYYNEPQITNGTSATTFSPNKTCNRGEILTYLWRSVGQPEPTISNPYSDVKTGKYYAKAAIWAYEKGIETGDGSKFYPGTECTRAAIVTYIYRVQYKPLEITDELSITSDRKLKLTVSGGGSQLTYSWRTQKYGAGSWSTFDEKTTTERTAASKTLVYTGKYYCIVTDETGAGVRSATMYYGSASAQPLTITKQPKSVQLANSSASAVLSVETSGGSGTVSYQWQKWDGAAAAWKDVSTGSTLTVNGTNPGKYHCVVKDEGGTELVSNIARVTVKTTAELTITQQPKDVLLSDMSETAVLSITTSGGSGTITYRWEKWDYENRKWVKRSTGRTANIPGTGTGRFRCVVTDGAGTELISRTTLVRMPLQCVSTGCSLDSETGNQYWFAFVFSGGVGPYQVSFRWRATTDTGSGMSFKPSSEDFYTSYNNFGELVVHLRSSNKNAAGKTLSYQAIVKDYEKSSASSGFIRAN